MLDPNFLLVERLVQRPPSRSDRCGTKVTCFTFPLGLGVALLLSLLRVDKPQMAQETFLSMAWQYPHATRAHQFPQVTRGKQFVYPAQLWHPKQPATHVPQILHPKHNVRNWARLRSPVVVGGIARAGSVDALHAQEVTAKSENATDAEFALNRVYEAVFGGVDPPKEFALDFSTTQLNSHSVCQCWLRTTDGAFVIVELEMFEDANAPNGTFIAGYDGELSTWLFEGNMRVEVELDEKEAMILSTWSTNVLYALPNIRRKLEFEVISGEEWGRRQLEFEAVRGEDGSGVDKDEIGVDEICVAIRLRETSSSTLAGFLTAYQFIDRKTWLPRRAQIIYGGGRKTIALSAWRPGQAVPSTLFPTSTYTVDINLRESTANYVAARPRASAGEFKQVPFTARAQALESVLLDALPGNVPAERSDDFFNESVTFRFETDAENEYRGPIASHNFTFNDTTFDDAAGNELTLVKNPAGQLLIPATINGRNVGYWLLDTGCSTNVMTNRARFKLGLPKFSEVNATVLGGLSSAAFVEVEKFTVGPMTMNDTVFAVMDLSSLQSYDGPEVAGILGYDFFIRATIEVQNDGSGGWWSNNRRAFIYDPSKSINLTAVGPWDTPKYSPLKFLFKTAHLEAAIKSGYDIPPSRNLMFLDLGAGSSHVQFNMGKARNIGVTADSYGRVMEHQGVGNGRISLRSVEAPLDYVEIGETRLDQRDLSARLFDANIDLSNRGNGVLCMRLFEDCRFVIDYPRKQLGVSRKLESEAKDFMSKLRELFTR